MAASSSSSSSSVVCPLCKRNDRRVELPSWTFESTTVEVPTCSTCEARTFAVSVEMKVSAIQGLTARVAAHSASMKSKLAKAEVAKRKMISDFEVVAI